MKSDEKTSEGGAARMRLTPPLGNFRGATPGQTWVIPYGFFKIGTHQPRLGSYLDLMISKVVYTTHFNCNAIFEIVSEISYLEYDYLGPS